METEKIKSKPGRYLIIYSYKSDERGYEFCKLKRGDIDDARNGLRLACTWDITRLNYRIYDITKSPIHIPSLKHLRHNLKKTEQVLINAGFTPVRTHASEYKLIQERKDRANAEYERVMNSLY